MAQADTTPRTTLSELSAFQRDLLFVIASVEPAKGLKIRDEVSEYYTDKVNNGRLYPNLDTLVEKGFVEKGQFDKRTNAYELTERGRKQLETRRQWEAECVDSEVSA